MNLRVKHGLREAVPSSFSPLPHRCGRCNCGGVFCFIEYYSCACDAMRRGAVGELARRYCANFVSADGGASPLRYICAPRVEKY